MKRWLSLLLAAVLTLSLAACGGGGAPAQESAESTADTSGGSIRLVNGKIEVDAALKKLAAMYKEETGVDVSIESMGGGIDIQGTLKGYYQAGNMPDIFVNGGASDFANWAGLCADMSDQPWASDTDAAYINDDGTVGFPYTVTTWSR